MTATQKAIIRVLLYFDIFGHPLKKSELFCLTGVRSEKKDFEESLAELVRLDLISHEADHFYITESTSSVSDRLLKQNHAVKYHRISRIISALIYFHPFVRGVLVSGSLSKNIHSKKDDIDYFVITEPGRLWICRTLLMLFKKIFLLNSKKYFCINYYVDSKTLEIPDKNLFTATEIAFLIPLQDYESCRIFFSSNDWILEFFPNLIIDLQSCRRRRKYLVKKIAERLLQGNRFDRLDSYLMNMYRKRSSKLYGTNSEHRFESNFKSEKNVSKYHPNGFQHLIMENYNLKISGFEVAHKVDLSQ